MFDLTGPNAKKHEIRAVMDILKIIIYFLIGFMYSLLFALFSGKLTIGLVLVGSILSGSIAAYCALRYQWYGRRLDGLDE